MRQLAQFITIISRPPWRHIRCAGLLLLVLCFNGCTSTAFLFPLQQQIRTPDVVGVKYEDVYFQSSDHTKLHGWFMPASTEHPKATILFLHGNAENISTHFGAVYWLPEAGFNVFIFDYRGYGLSEGEADIDGVHLDAAAALDYLRHRKDVDNSKLVIFGQSLGGATAIYTVATSNQEGIQAVIIESAFSSYRKITREKLGGFFLTWPFQWPLSFLIDNDYSPIKYIRALDPAPKLFIHGDADLTIPESHSIALYEEAGGEKELWLIHNGRHIAAMGQFREIYRPALVHYLDRTLNTSK